MIRILAQTLVLVLCVPFVATAGTQTPPPGPYLKTCNVTVAPVGTLASQTVPMISGSCNVGSHKGETKGVAFDWSHCGTYPIVNRGGVVACGPTKPALPSDSITSQGVVLGAQGTEYIEIASLNGGPIVTLFLPKGYDIHKFHRYEIVKYVYTNSQNERTVHSNLFSMSEIKPGGPL